MFGRASSRRHTNGQINVNAVTSLDVTSRKLLSLELALPFDLWIQLRRGWPIRGDDRLCFHLHNFLWSWRSHLSWSGGVPMNKTLDTPQIARFRLGRVGRTDFSCSPSAREARQERRSMP